MSACLQRKKTSGTFLTTDDHDSRTLMTAVKTAISLDSELLERVDALAEELDLPRSRVLAQAAEDFLRRRESQRFLGRLDAVYGAESKSEPEESRSHRRARHRQIVEGTW